jgi:hypothetical protein
MRTRWREAALHLEAADLTAPTRLDLAAVEVEMLWPRDTVARRGASPTAHVEFWSGHTDALTRREL